LVGLLKGHKEKYKMKRSIWQTLLLWVLPLAFLLIFFYQPLLAIFRLVFSAQFSQGWKLFRWSQITKPLAFTLYQATLYTVRLFWDCPQLICSRALILQGASFCGC